jgi:GT2 family glycosyltransferase
LVFRSNGDFVKEIEKKWNKHYNFNELLSVNGARADCRTCPPHPPSYWYYMAVAKKHVEAIGGVDEDFATGICAEDDDFSNRMRLSGVTPVFEHNIIGIHQDHSFEDSLDIKHGIRTTDDGKQLRQKNVDLMRKNLSNRKIVANTDHIWGDEKVIISCEDL